MRHRGHPDLARQIEQARCLALLLRSGVPVPVTAREAGYFDQLALADPEDVDELEFYAVAGRRQVPELAEVRAPERLAGGDQVALGELIVDLHGGVGEPPQQRTVERLEATRGPVGRYDGPTPWAVVVHEPRMDDLVRERQVVLILAAFHELGHNALVVVP